MNLLIWIIFGALVGWVASIITDADQSQEIVLDVVSGVVGAFLGGMMLSLFGTTDAGGFDISSLVTAVIGAVILVSLVRAVSNNTRSHVFRV